MAAAAALGVFVALVMSVEKREPATEPAASGRPAAREADAAPTLKAGAPVPPETPKAAAERLRAWADGVPLAEIPAELERIQNLDSIEARVAARRALLFSWTSRDLVAVMRWLGDLGASHSLQQEGREQIVGALLECEPEDVVVALRESLPETTARQLYGPYFRGWAASDPVAAAEMLVRLGAEEPRAAAQWNDLLGEVSAQWMASAPADALSWLKALPEGAGKASALLQASYRWTELDPEGAARFSASREDPRLVKTVAAKWAETAPAKAVAWARTLPEGTLRDDAVAAALAIWAQTEPRAAARWEKTLATGASPTPANVVR